MMPEEKAQLLALLEHEERWCRDVEAVNAAGVGVAFDDREAVAWDLTGALCRLFGWQRACVLFGQLERHLVGKRKLTGWPVRDTPIDAMAALQAFNDDPGITFAALRERLGSMPVWSGSGRGTPAT